MASLWREYGRMRRNYQRRKARLEASEFADTWRVRNMADLPKWSELSEAERGEMFEWLQNQEQARFGVKQLRSQVDEFGVIATILDPLDAEFQAFASWVVMFGTDYIWGSPEYDANNYGMSKGHNRWGANSVNWQTEIPVNVIKATYNDWFEQQTHRWYTDEESSSNVYKSR